MKCTLFIRLAMALPVVLALSFSTARPAQACAGFPYAVAGINCANVFIGLGRTPLDPATHLALTLFYMNFGPFIYAGSQPWVTTPVSAPATEPPPPTEPTPSDAGHIVPPVADGSKETGKPEHMSLIDALLNLPTEEGGMTPMDPPKILDSGGEPEVESVVPELTPIVTIAGKEIPEDRLFASFGPRISAPN
ncbi:MAG: hypothetical protein OEY85_00055 [Rhodospirillales bacterium]|nr:hypothetical protein [Rhodospirillales bacterium]